MQPIFHEARIRSGYRTKLKLTYKQTVPPAFADVCSNLASYNQSRQRVLGHEPALRAWDQWRRRRRTRPPFRRDC